MSDNRISSFTGLPFPDSRYATYRWADKSCESSEIIRRIREAGGTIYLEGGKLKGRIPVQFKKYLQHNPKLHGANNKSKKMEIIDRLKAEAAAVYVEVPCTCSHRTYPHYHTPKQREKAKAKWDHDIKKLAAEGKLTEIKGKTYRYFKEIK